jgi:hypothetical protein
MPPGPSSVVTRELEASSSSSANSFVRPRNALRLAGMLPSGASLAGDGAEGVGQPGRIHRKTWIGSTPLKR